VRQWVLSFPFPLRFLFASRPEIMGKVLGIVYRALATQFIRKAGYTALSPCPRMDHREVSSVTSPARRAPRRWPH